MRARKALYRMFLPHISISRSRFAFHQHETPVQELSEADVIIVQRQASRGNLVAIRQMKAMGLKIVYDLDDDLWGIPGSSPAKRLFEPIKLGFAPCMELCDCITVSTEGLKTAVLTAVPSMKQKEIIVIPNAMDFNYFHPPILPRNPEKIVVGWGGSNTHFGDIGIAFRVLPELLDELPQLYLEFVGHDPPKSIINHPRVRLREFVPVGEYAARFSTWGWDVVLAPLDDCRFNRSKSAIKFLEAAAIGAPCLMSAVGPYRSVCELDSSLKWLLCRTSEDWKQKIKALVVDAGLRQEMARHCRRVAEDNFEQSKIAVQWMTVFENLVAA